MQKHIFDVCGMTRTSFTLNEEIKEKKFYQLEVKITYSDDIETTQSFIVHTFDTDRALMIISHYLKTWEEKRQKEHEEKETTMKVTFDVKLSASDVFRFNINQAYRGIQGLISVLLPAVIIGAVIKNYSEFGFGNAMLYLGIAVFLLLYVPGSLWLRSKKILKTNEVLANTLHFEFEDI